MRQELRNAFTTPRFWIALAAMTICLFGFSLPTWVIRLGDGDRMYMDALSQGFSPIFFGGAILIFPFLATLAYATSQVDETRTGFMQTKAIRTTTIKYIWTKIVPVALSGAAVMGLAVLIHSIVWNIVAGPYDPIARPDTEVFMTEGTVYNTLMKTPYAWQAFLHAVIGFAITGAVWSVVGLASSAWIPDKILTITVPVAVYFFWAYRLPYCLFGINAPTPSALYNDGQYWSVYFTAVVLHIIVFFVAALLYYKGIKRRLQNA